MTSTAVVGGGIAGLVAARSAAIRGDDVTLVESSGGLGGRVSSVEVGGVRVDVGAESYASRGTQVSQLVAALGLVEVDPVEGGAWLQLADRAVPLPGMSVLGIPGSPLATDVRAVIGARAAWRAWADRVIPELHVGRETDLDRLVRRRMGDSVLEKLVRPVVDGVYGLDPADADAEALIPGINGALTATGSLSSAVLSLRGGAQAGAAVRGIRGGVHLLADALVDDLRARGVRLLKRTTVDGVRPDGDDWRVSGPAFDERFRHVVIATPGDAARDLLEASVGREIVEGWPDGRDSTVVVLVIDDDRLDDSPRGTGVLVADRVDGAATALTHSSAKWPWLREALPRGRHVLRLSYKDRVAIDVRRAVSDASRLSGVDLRPQDVVGHASRSWRQDVSRAYRGVSGRIDRLRLAVDELDGLSVVGAWVAGTGLAAVVRDAQRPPT
ncbi:protoporphyrinogen/coproporphyrinogen oxidase [Amnibacterium flavum]|uniref:Protoporphyrinogen oxidase n=1 Tax=Amnibacterium flavum TaxID=2173173 RepID=A0A2V1HSB8_9MICO|nr:FAD-dependent oxidoreductase [Amnibacterium flavum]PVZ95516.1 protoporphyrinogen oxidase [Amnibacterium flavum]